MPPRRPKSAPAPAVAPAPEHRPGSRGARAPLWAALGLVAAVSAAYLNSLHGVFVWDDLPTIVTNPAIEHLRTAFDRPAQVNTAAGRPLVAFSLWFNHALGGRDVLGYHLFNLAVHLTATLALFGLVRRGAGLPGLGIWFRDRSTALALSVAALWSLHPLQTQAVTYVVQRAESLMGLCYLLTLYFFVRAIGSPRPARWYTASVAACALGMTAKEVMVSAPFLVLLLDRTFCSGGFRQAWASRKGYYAALFSTLFLLAWLVVGLGGDRGGSTGGFSFQASWVPYALTQFHAVALYLKLTFWPHPQIFQYGPAWLSQPLDALPYALWIVPLLLLSAVALVRWPKAGFFGFWFFAVLSVTSLVPGTVDMVVEHRMYVALAPICILVSAGLYRLTPRTAPALVCLAAVALGGTTFARNELYGDAIRFWADNTAKRPQHALSHYNLGNALLEAGRLDEARGAFETVVSLNPAAASAHFKLASILEKDPSKLEEALRHYAAVGPDNPYAGHAVGLLHCRRGELDLGLQQFEGVIQRHPNFTPAYLSLGEALAHLGRWEEAVQAFRLFVQREPNQPQGHERLGLVLAHLGRADESIPELREALRLNPTWLHVRLRLAVQLAERKNQVEEAAALLREAVRQKPDFAEAHFQLGLLLARTPGTLEQAISEFQQTAQYEPHNPRARFTLASALESAGRNDAAIEQYRELIRLHPSVAEGHFRLGRLLAQNPDRRFEATMALQRALELNPDFPPARELLDGLLRPSP